MQSEWNEIIGAAAALVVRPDNDCDVVGVSVTLVVTIRVQNVTQAASASDRAGCARPGRSSHYASKGSS